MLFMYQFLLGLTAAIVFAMAAVAQEAPSAKRMLVAESAVPAATLILDGGADVAGAGYAWGHGRLEYHRRQLGFNLTGISVVDVGAPDVTADGEVYNLSRLSDFNGDYVAIAAGATVRDGASVAYLMNEHGVIIKLHSPTVGLRFTLSADGVHIRTKI
jgi:hypothetical protein